MTQFQSRVLALAPAILVLAVILHRTSYTVADPDLWGHIRFGQDICEAGEIIDSDPYSYLSGEQGWVNHEWLCEVAFAVLYDRFGTPGLAVFKTALVMALSVFLYRDFRRHGGSPIRSAILLLGTGFVMMPGLGTLRPHLFTYLGFLMMLLVIRAADRGQARFLWAAPLIIAIWVNLHGGVLAGLGILVIWLIMHFTCDTRMMSRTSTRENAGIIVASILSITACVANPYGWHLPLFLIRTATKARPDIGEWAALDITSPFGLFYMVLVIVAILAWCGSTRKRTVAISTTVACTMLLPLIAVRHLPLFALAFAILVAEHVLDGWQRLSPESSLPSGRGHNAVNFVALLAGILLVGLSWPNLKCIHLDPHYFRFPSRAVAFMKHHGYRGNLAVLFDWGEYVIWHLGPDVKVSIDGRRETVYSEGIRETNTKWIRGTGNWDALLTDYPTTMALVDKRFPVYNLMKLQNGWALEYEDAVCALFVSRGVRTEVESETNELDRVPADGRGLCFP